MSIPPKAPPVYKPTPLRLAAPSVYRPNQANGPTAQLKPANHFRLETRPATPVDWPQQSSNSSAQLKPANNFRLETRPAPPVYRPQQTYSPGVQPMAAMESRVETQPGRSVRPMVQVAKGPERLHPSRPSFNGIPIVQRSVAAISSQSVERKILSVPRSQPQAAPNFKQAAVAFRPKNPPIQRAFLAGISNYFFPPTPAIQAPAPPPPTAEERHQQLLARNREHFLETGRPQYSEVREIYPNALDPVKWEHLTHVHGQVKNLKKRAKNQSPEAIHGLVRELFNNFVSYGFGYSIMASGASRLLDTVTSKDSPNGSCLAYARAFADIVNSFGIEAEAEYVREEDAGRFIVKLERFIDPRVSGHIYEKGVLKAGYFMFTSHAATWVPATGRYYDPMAVAWYESLDPYIECELDSENETVFTPKTRPKTLCTGYEWKLIRRDLTLPGQFNKLDLVPLKKKKKR